MECCRHVESGMGAIGNWYTPSCSAVITLSNLGQTTDTFYRVVYAQRFTVMQKESVEVHKEKSKQLGFTITCGTS